MKPNMKQKTLRILPLALALAMLPLAGCTEDEDLLVNADAAGNELLARYVALGNSITAGFQSGGINASTQAQAYPVLLAQQAGVRFDVPALRLPGCPAPFVAPFGIGGRLGGAAAPPCALRADTLRGRPTQNLAVPGAKVINLLDNLAPAPDTSTILTQLVLGGRTQAQALVDARPTFASVWIGNNDALGAALAGQPARLTAAATFEAQYTDLVQAVGGSTAEGAVLIGVVNPTVVPALQPGAYFFLAASQSGGRFGGPEGKPVSPTCAPGTPGGSNLVSILILSDPNFPTVDCSDEAYPAGDPRRGTYVLTPAEIGAIGQRVAAFNASVQSLAEANGYLYFDPNQLLLPFLADPSQIRKCQGLATATTLAQLGAAVQSSCPGPAPSVGFGALFSFDGVHPSGAAHQVIANALAASINAQYGTQIRSSGN